MVGPVYWNRSLIIYTSKHYTTQTNTQHTQHKQTHTTHTTQTNTHTTHTHYLNVKQQIKNGLFPSGFEN